MKAKKASVSSQGESSPVKAAAVEKKGSLKEKKAVEKTPKYSEMILNALTDLKDKKGTSKKAIENFVETNYKGKKVQIELLQIQAQTLLPFLSIYQILI